MAWTCLAKRVATTLEAVAADSKDTLDAHAETIKKLAEMIAGVRLPQSEILALNVTNSYGEFESGDVA